MSAPRRAPRARIDGVLLLDKPRGITSNDALMQARRLLNAAKAGHGGTLDPMATGLLPLAFGEATKFLHDLLEADKSYVADVLFGTATATGDADGEVIARGHARVERAQLEAALAAFRGPIRQVPPMYSALKHAGRPLYEYARAGQTLVREAREVVIHELELLECEPGRARVRVRCSKGTYVRTLAEDLGTALGTVAHLCGLQRTRVGVLDLTDALRLELPLQLGAAPAAQLAAARAAAQAALRPVDALLSSLPACAIDEAAAIRFANGQRVAMPPDVRPVAPGARVRVYCARRLLGVARIADEAFLAPERVVGCARSSTVL